MAARFLDEWVDDPRLDEAGPVAMALFFRAVGFASRHRTDGFVARASTARLLATRAWERHAAALVRVGLWREVEGGFEIVDYLDHQDSREEIEAFRRYERERKRSQRLRSVRSPAARPAGTPAARPAGSPGRSPASSPLPSEEDGRETPSVLSERVGHPAPPSPDATSGPPPADPRGAGPKPARDLFGEVEAEPDGSRRGGAGPSSRAEVESGPESPGNSPTRGKPKSAPPSRSLPFRAIEAIRAVSDAAGPRTVAPVEPRDVGRGRAIAVEKLVREGFGDLGEWRDAGAYLAAGGAPGIVRPLGIGFLASDSFRDVLAQARAWRAAGSPPIARTRLAAANAIPEIAPARPKLEPEGFASRRPAVDALAELAGTNGVAKSGAPGRVS